MRRSSDARSRSDKSVPTTLNALTMRIQTKRPGLFRSQGVYRIEVAFVPTKRCIFPLPTNEEV
jgi:hypothetical protein